MSTDQHTGRYGTAHRVPEAVLANHPGVASWIITAPAWHPLWSQYTLSATSLADHPDHPPAVKTRPEVTHEIILIALDPGHGPYEAAQIGPGSLRFLLPVNICEQITATDGQAAQIAELCARSVVDGILEPETSNGPDRIRAAWRTAIHQTLDHFRDPHHGQEN